MNRLGRCIVRTVLAGTVALVVLGGRGHLSHAQTSRALLVGIDTYVPDASAQAASAQGRTARQWTNLQGAVHDVTVMETLLTARFGFSPSHIHTRTEADATREGILSAIQTHLIDASRPGDTAVFYYAGHGSQVVNQGSAERDRLDETLVPADAATGVQDIRDKELRPLFNALLEKGVTLTLIFDSCHSGSVTRGVTPRRTRAVAPPPQPISDPGEMPPPPQEHPAALVFSAAQENQKAHEITDEQGIPRGAFSWALSTVLSRADADLPARFVLERVRALLGSHSIPQEPVLEGSAERRNRGIFGGASADSSEALPLAVPVLEVTDTGEVVTSAGHALSVRPGTQLQPWTGTGTPSSDATPVRVRVDSVEGLVLCQPSICG